jgi:hypothetical protein
MQQRQKEKEKKKKSFLQRVAADAGTGKHNDGRIYEYPR